MSILRKFINKCLSVARLGEKWCNKLVQSIIEAGRTIGYVETYNPSQTDSLHLAIKQSENRIFIHEFEKSVRFAIAKLKLKRVKIGFDTTEDLTWIKEGFNIRPSIDDSSLLSWQYLNVSIVDPFYLPLMSIPYRQIDDLDKLVVDLLCYIKTLPIIVELILFDRGFYHADLIDYLDGRKRGYSWPYLMLVPEREAQRDYIKQTRDGNKRFAFYNHIFSYSKDKSKRHPSANIIVRIVDDKTAWCYATNQKPSLNLCMEYPKRWTLEAGFRVHDEARIKSRSIYLKIRFFYHLIGMLLIILWRLQNSVKQVVFKMFLKNMDIFFTKLSLVKPDPP